MVIRCFRKCLSALAMVCCMPMLAAEYPTKTIDGKEYYEYSVQKSEGFYAISKKFGVSQAEIQATNPQTVKGLKEGESLLIPKKNNQGMTHKVQKSETLFSLKQKYGLTYDDLYEANPTLKTKGLIEGTQINIPQKNNLIARRNKAQAEKENDAPAPVATTASAAQTEQQRHVSKPNFSAHEVKKGETLFSISRQYNITTEEIVRLNPDAKEGIKTGQILIIPPTHKGTAAETDGSTKKSELKTHVVKKGETVYSISKQYGINQDALVQRNPGIDKELQEGKLLIIPPVFKSTAFAEEDFVEQKPLYKVHIVKKEETVFGLSKQYGITMEELIKGNPMVADGLKEGMVLRIPLSATEIEESEKADSIQSLGQMFNAEPKNTIDMALALPWGFAKVTETSKIDATTAKFIEFYDGMLLAIDTLRKQGLNINLHLYDSGKTEADVQKMLEYDELKKMDFIIGPAYQGQVKAMADFALMYDVKLVVPFTSKSPEVYANSAVFQVNAPQEISAANVAHQIATSFSDKKIVIVTFSDPKYNDRQVWADTLKFSLDAMGVENTVMIYSTLSEMRKAMSKKKENIVFPVTNDQVALSQVLPIVNMLKSKDYTVSVLGFSDWQNYSSISKELFKLNTYFTTPFFIDFSNPQVVDFLRKYRKYYNAEPSNTQPMYALLGYDIVTYFSEAVSKYGHSFDWAVDKVKPALLQSEFRFEKVNENGGYANTTHYIIENNDEIGRKKFVK